MTAVTGSDWPTDVGAWQPGCHGRLTREGAERRVCCGPFPRAGLKLCPTIPLSWTSLLCVICSILQSLAQTSSPSDGEKKERKKQDCRPFRRHPPRHFRAPRCTTGSPQTGSALARPGCLVPADSRADNGHGQRESTAPGSTTSSTTRSTTSSTASSTASPSWAQHDSPLIMAYANDRRPAIH